MPDDGSIDVSSIPSSGRSASLTAAFAPTAESAKPARKGMPPSGGGNSGGGQDQARDILNQMVTRNANDEANLNRGLAANRVNVSSSGIQSYRKGGKVRKTGVARLHKGERAAACRAKGKR